MLTVTNDVEVSVAWTNDGSCWTKRNQRERSPTSYGRPELTVIVLVAAVSVVKAVRRTVLVTKVGGTSTVSVVKARPRTSPRRLRGWLFRVRYWLGQHAAG